MGVAPEADRKIEIARKNPRVNGGQNLGREGLAEERAVR
jgi:hypothetical protein